MSAGLASVTSTAAQTVPADWAQARQQRIEALARGDRAAFDRLTADSFIVVDPTGRIENKAERGARLAPAAPVPGGGGGIMAPRLEQELAYDGQEPFRGSGKPLPLVFLGRFHN